jgi:hypothetical protein
LASGQPDKWHKKEKEKKWLPEWFGLERTVKKAGFIN